MKLIKQLDIRFHHGKPRRFCLFYCHECCKNIEMVKEVGIRQKTCGCKRHGLYGKKIWGVWWTMVNRCCNENVWNYHRYGGRGIKVCDEWKTAKNFILWALSNGYSENLQIDRIDNSGNYEPSNCRFVTRAVNGQNTRTNKLTAEKVTSIRSLLKDGIKTRQELAKIYNVTCATIGYVVNRQTWKNI